MSTSQALTIATVVVFTLLALASQLIRIWQAREQDATDREVES
jgi:hypothetical protein